MERRPILHLPKQHRARARVGTIQGSGARIKEIKVVAGKSMDREERIKCLVALAHEHGHEKLLHEIEVHRQKIADLTEALEVYSHDRNHTA